MTFTNEEIQADLYQSLSKAYADAAGRLRVRLVESYGKKADYMEEDHRELSDEEQADYVEAAGSRVDEVAKRVMERHDETLKALAADASTEDTCNDFLSTLRDSEVLRAIEIHGAKTFAEIFAATNEHYSAIEKPELTKTLKRLVAEKTLVTSGAKRGTRYHPNYTPEAVEKIAEVA